MLSVVHLKNENKVIACDFNGAALYSLNMNNESIEKFEHYLITEPSGLCVGKNDELFVSECLINNILVFDSNLNFLRQFLIQEKLREALKMQIDLIDRKNLLYISHKNHNKITVWNSQRGYLINTIKLDAPSSMEFDDEFLYVVSYTEWDRDDNLGKLINIRSGSNCIFILKKANYETVNEIKLNNWLQPFGLWLNKCKNIITTVYEIDENNIISKDRYLYSVNKKGVILNKIQFEHMRGTRDLIFFKNKMIRCYKSDLKFIVFDY